MEKNIYDMLNDGSFDNKEYNEENYINETINDIEKEKIKKYVLGNKAKNRKILKVIAVPALLALIVGITSIPAVAENVPVISDIYKALGLKEKYLDYTKYIGKTVEHKGIKVTIDNIVATKDKVMISTKIEGNSNIDMDELSEVDIKIGLKSKVNNDEFGSQGEFYDNDDKNNVIHKVLEIKEENIIQEKDELKLEIKFPDEYKKEVNYEMDFSKAFNDVIEIKSGKEIKELNMSIDKIQADALGSKILVTNSLQEFDSLSEIRLILKINNIVYKNGSATIAKEGNGEFSFNNATYKDFNNANNVSILPIICNVTDEDEASLYNELQENNYFEDNTTEDNIIYKKNIKFKDGTIGEVYKVERDNNLVRLYYKGATEKHALLMALTSDVILGSPEEKSMEKSYSLDLYKDTNVENGYVVEIKGIDENEKVQVYNSPNIAYIDKYIIGEEVKIK